VESEYVDKIKVAVLIAKIGNTVKVLPEIDRREQIFRKKIFSNYLPIKSNPDFLINDEYWDLKCPEKENNIISNMNQAHNRPDVYAILFDKKVK
jgi:hypothetical protein